MGSLIGCPSCTWLIAADVAARLMCPQMRPQALFAMPANMKIGTMKNYRKEVNQMNYRERQALDHWLTTPPDDGDDEEREAYERDPQQAEIEHLKDSLAQSTQQCIELEDKYSRAMDDLAAARADLNSLANAAVVAGGAGGAFLVERLAHINDMPPGWCYCDDCRNAASIRILARVWKEGQAR